jgi:enoyl-CoA hydratase/carnithine racemase
MKYETIKFEKEDGFAIITLDRPERMNALNTQLKKELFHAHHEILKDDKVITWILTGAPRPDGRPCFCAGADLKDDAAGTPRWDYSPEYKGPFYVEEDDMFPVNTAAGRLWAKRPRMMISPINTNIFWSPKISIAAVDGVATAGGIELALVCDIILASETAQFTDSHVKNLKSAIGGASVTTSLTRRVGYSKALELCILGDFIDGNEAYRIGLANRVYPPDKLMEGAKEMARKIAGMRPAALHLTKLSCRSVFDWNFYQAWNYGDELLKWNRLDPTWAGLQGVTKHWEKRKR